MPPSDSETQTVSFAKTGAYLESVRGRSDRQAKDFVITILQDLHHGELPELLTPDPGLYFTPLTVSAQNRYGRPIQQLEWFNGADIELQYMFGDGLPQVESPLDLSFDLVWMDLTVQTENTIRVAPSAMRGLRSEMVTTLYDANTNVGRGVLEERCVLLVTIDGPAYKTPELTVLGPSRRAKRAEGEESSYSVNIVHFPFHDLADEHSRAADFTDRLNSHLSALARRGNGWKDAFKSSVETLSEARGKFRRKLREELQKTMGLFEETHQPASDDELNLLRQAASLVAYRTMFLQEIERRGRLYHGSPSPARLGSRKVSRSLVDELAYRVDGEQRDTIDGALLARLVHTARAIRGDIDDDAIAITGASIFDNRHPNFEEGIGSWLDAMESLADEGSENNLLSRWDERIRKLGSVMLGHLDDEYRHEVNLIGEGAHRHRHRVLGNIYEQILAMTPKRGEDGEIKLMRPEDNDDDDRSSLGAHYTPINLVEEVVRPTLGRLFRQYWDNADGKVGEYRQRIRQMTLVDPAMGSAHFLTVAALEIARELAWLKFFDQPRFEILEEWAEPLNHHNSIGRDPDPERSESYEESEKDREENDKGSEKWAGESNEDQFYHPGHHDEFVRAVRNELSGVIQRSIYGVDKNALATELSKLSLWLFEVGEVDGDGSLTSHPELTYLDANIRCGDSAVGVFLEDVQKTVRNALRSRKSFGGHQQTMMGLMNQTETVQEKLDRAKRYRRALQEIPTDFSSFDPRHLDAEIREEIDFNEVDSGYDLRRRIDGSLRRYLSELDWVFDLTLIIRYLGYTSSSKAGRAGKLYWALFGDEPPGDKTSDIKPLIEKALLTLFENPDSEEALTHRLNLIEWLESQSDLEPFHWEMEFPNAFTRGGFDAVVANPPFIGDRDLRERLGSEDLVEYLANYFIPQKKKSDYSGFFFWRYHQIANDTAAIGSLASNSLAQASNREYVTLPLTYGDEPHFHIFRAIPNRDWLGDANVHFSALYLSRGSVDRPHLVRPDFSQEPVKDQPFAIQHDEGVSSYLDEYPDFVMRALPASASRTFTYTGMFLRGNFSIHREPEDTLLDAVNRIPDSERDALAAYLNADDIQRSHRVTPSDVVIDFFEPLKNADLENSEPAQQREWIEANYPTLFDQLQSPSPHAPDKDPVYNERRELEHSTDNTPHKRFWWLFGRPRTELRKAWEDVEEVVVFPGVTKVWSPLLLPKNMEDEGGNRLRICPIHALFVAPGFTGEHFAVTSSFLFEMLTRRRSSSLKSDLRFTPTDVFPYFPWPWKPEVDGYQLTSGSPPDDTKEALESAAESLIDLRIDILENPTNHGLTRDLIGGPTDLYNLYDSDPSSDDPRHGADAPAIEELRQAHVNLLDVVLRAYSWDDIADELTRNDWTFDRPWLDRTERFVPPEPVRAELFRRIDKLNTERYELERDMMIDIIVEHLPEEGMTKTGFSQQEPFCKMQIDKNQFEVFMKYEQEKKEKSRVRKDGYRWKAV